ncbi:hypothetical protein GQ43DRAFT_19384 [Delitschia confertaspora ATCC 74209]|uniref:Uncharacterized protein n=1 Tax=Delitschia confertaspora ATCC 74209 TaxID=1513339 RepID=A0A9P4JP71_9PLEO|nr:hypothetical protein GQ43DRAFT_19384 [Delitschia confertaspora ATCC 74209]
MHSRADLRAVREGRERERDCPAECWWYGFDGCFPSWFGSFDFDTPVCIRAVYVWYDYYVVSLPWLSIYILCFV